MEELIQNCVGIDVAQNELVCSFAQRTGLGNINIIANAVFVNSEKGFKALLKWQQKIKPLETPIQFVMEATGVYHQRCVHFLHANGYDVSVVLPNKAMHFMKTLHIKTITDQTSANALAQMGIEKQLENWEAPHPLYNQLKHYSRERNRLVEERSAIKNLIHAEKAGEESGPKTIKRMEKRVELMNKQIKEVEKDMKELIATDAELKRKLEFITSIPGVGFITAASIVGETQGFRNIENKRQLVSYAGLDIVVKNSGTSVRSKPRISKRGNKHIRKAVHLPALSAIRNDENMKSIFVRLVSKHGIKMKAVVAVQRKILQLMYTLWVKEQMYDADHYQKNLGQVANAPALTKLIE